MNNPIMPRGGCNSLLFYPFPVRHPGAGMRHKADDGLKVFGYQDARATRTAFGAFQERIGVCRDYAHLAIALCRCMNIPGRYVNGYLGDIDVPILDPMDFSASRGSRCIWAAVG
jgi:hypothetical protein